MKIKTEGLKNDLLNALTELKNHYPIQLNHLRGDVFFTQVDGMGLKIEKGALGYCVYYEDLRYALRALAKLMSDHTFTHYREKTHLTKFTVMLDNSRNAVTTVSKLKEFIRNAALLGYNAVSLYLEDMYELEDYPAFGLLRGRYSKAELKEVNQYAKLFGVEMVASIQTLGHLQQIFHYKYFDSVKDTAGSLLVGSEETYKLIDAMIGSISECFDSRQIYLGMDEVHSLGKGNHIEKFGYEKPAVIFLRHIHRVVEITKKYGYEYPTVWSDMFIKMFSAKHSYRDDTVIIPEDFIKEVDDISLGYWDYDSTDVAYLEKMMDIHHRFKKPLVLVTGLTTWFTLAAKHWKTKDVLDVFANLAEKKNIEQLMVTIWGDDGAYCNPETYYQGLFYLSEKVYRKDGKIDKAKYNQLFHYDYDIMETLSKIDYKFNGDGFEIAEKTRYVSFATSFFDDPLYGIGYNNELRFDEKVIGRTIEHYTGLANELESCYQQNLTYKMTYYAALICKLKLQSRDHLIRGYFTKNKELLEEVLKEYQEIIRLFKIFLPLFEKMWMNHFKTYGYDVMQNRLTGIIARYQFSMKYIKRYMTGRIQIIEELEESKKVLKPIRIKDFYNNLGVITIGR